MYHATTVYYKHHTQTHACVQPHNTIKPEWIQHMQSHCVNMHTWMHTVLLTTHATHARLMSTHEHNMYCNKYMHAHGANQYMHSHMNATNTCIKSVVCNQQLIQSNHALCVQYIKLVQSTDKCKQSQHTHTHGWNTLIWNHTLLQHTHAFTQ